MFTQTLLHLHLKSHICHLDLTPANIMLQKCSDSWDQLRLIDFGFATRFDPGEHIAFAWSLLNSHMPNILPLNVAVSIHLVSTKIFLCR